MILSPCTGRGDLPTEKRISVHKTISMVERYSHQNGAHIKTAMDKLQSGYRLDEADRVAFSITPKLHKAQNGG